MSHFLHFLLMVFSVPWCLFNVLEILLYSSPVQARKSGLDTERVNFSLVKPFLLIFLSALYWLPCFSLNLHVILALCNSFILFYTLIINTGTIPSFLFPRHHREGNANFCAQLYVRKNKLWIRRNENLWRTETWHKLNLAFLTVLQHRPSYILSQNRCPIFAPPLFT